jgi:hypothetical protein
MSSNYIKNRNPYELLPFTQDEISLPFIELKVAINLQSIFLYFLYLSEDDQVSRNKSE